MSFIVDWLVLIYCTGDTQFFSLLPCVWKAKHWLGLQDRFYSNLNADFLNLL